MFKKFLYSWGRELILAIILSTIIMYFFKPIIICQTSMYPTLKDRDYVIISRQAYDMLETPRRGDIIVFQTDLDDEDGKDKNLVKRIIGLPGDIIEIDEGEVYLNGELLEEPYLNEPLMSGDMKEMIVPDGMFFCMGDNRGVSQDSRDDVIGCISKGDVLGRVVIRIYPFNTASFF